MSDRDEKLELRELKLPAELLPAHGQVRVRIPDRLGLGHWAELALVNREEREATAELPSGESVTLLFTGQPGCLYELRQPEPRAPLSEYAESLARSRARAEEAERLYAERLGQSGEGFPAWYLEERELPAGGLAAELREAARERMSGEGSGGSGLGLTYGEATGEPFLWRAQLGALVWSGGGLEGEAESWSRLLLFMSSEEAAEYLQGLRVIDLELYALELEEQASPPLSCYARQAAEKALALT